MNNCDSCKNISKLLDNSSTVIFAKENGSKILCKNNHIIYDGLQ